MTECRSVSCVVSSTILYAESLILFIDGFELMYNDALHDMNSMTDSLKFMQASMNKVLSLSWFIATYLGMQRG